MTYENNSGAIFDELFGKYSALVFFDTETNGLDPSTCQIIELAAQRIERASDGSLTVTASMDDLVQLQPGEKLPGKITELTHITDEMLANEGVTAATAADHFDFMITAVGNKPVLLIVHNAQFDLAFTTVLLWSCGQYQNDKLLAADYLDTLTVYKDRRAYPHRLANAIEDYGLSGKVKNSHRAIDDTEALVEVCKAMAAERDDLGAYVNIFGYNPKYGVSGQRVDGVTYWPQLYSNRMRAPSEILPELIRKELQSNGNN